MNQPNRTSISTESTGYTSVEATHAKKNSEVPISVQPNPTFWLSHKLTFLALWGRDVAESLRVPVTVTHLTKTTKRYSRRSHSTPSPICFLRVCHLARAVRISVPAGRVDLLTGTR